jgi:hypothetical protein
MPAAGERARQGCDRHRVRRDVVALDAVAPRHRADELAALIGHTHRQAINLGLHDVGQSRRGVGKNFAQPLVKVAQLGLGIRVVQALHRQPVPVGFESFAAIIADLRGW